MQREIEKKNERTIKQLTVVRLTTPEFCPEQKNPERKFLRT
jgi:hypothetical protein